MHQEHLQVFTGAPVHQDPRTQTDRRRDFWSDNDASRVDADVR